MAAKRTSRAKQPVPPRLRDPRSIKALAHPARLAVVDALASGDELTATECAALTGLSPSATAYHLNLLARYGFAEPAPARADGRARPWRAVDRGAAVDLDIEGPAGAAAATAVGLAQLDATRSIGERWLAHADQDHEEWRAAAALGNVDLWLSAAESEAVVAALAAALAPYRGRTRAGRPPGTRRVRVMTVLVPHADR